MSDPIYEKPPPYSPTPQEGVHQTYLTGSQPGPQISQSAPPYQAFAGQPYPPQYIPQQYTPLPYAPPNYGSTIITVTPQPHPLIGTCPACRIGFIEDDFTCLGIFCAIFFFPIGILLCLLLKDRRCNNCGAYFG